MLILKILILQKKTLALLGTLFTLLQFQTPDFRFFLNFTEIINELP